MYWPTRLRMRRHTDVRQRSRTSSNNNRIAWFGTFLTAKLVAEEVKILHLAKGC